MSFLSVIAWSLFKKDTILLGFLPCCITSMTIIVFVAIFTEISGKMISWAEALKDELIVGENPNEVLIGCRKFKLNS